MSGEDLYNLFLSNEPWEALSQGDRYCWDDLAFKVQLRLGTQAPPLRKPQQVIRQVRILVYEGTEKWLKSTLGKPPLALAWWDPGGVICRISDAILPLPADDHANLNQQVLAVFDQLRGERSAEAVQPIHDQEVGEAEEALRVEAEWLENQQPYDGSELGDLTR